MDAQRLENKLTRDAAQAKKAWLAEEDPAKSSKLQTIWKEAEDRLDRCSGWLEVRIPTRAASFDLHGMRQQVVPWREALFRVLPLGLAEVLRPGHAGDICTGELCTLLCPPHMVSSAKATVSSHLTARLWVPWS